MQYHSPSSFNEAVAISNSSSGLVKYLAGGTDVLVQLKIGTKSPDHLIDIKNIPGVKEISLRDDGGYTIGAAVSGAQLTEHKELSKKWPGLVEGMELVGSAQIQSRATLVGNLCNGSPAADSVPGMIAAGASVSIFNSSGTKDVLVEDIPSGPGSTSLENGELITAINLPKRNDYEGDAYLRFIPRTEMDIAVVGCAVNLSLENGFITTAKVVLGAVGPKVMLAHSAADCLVGTKLDDNILSRFSAKCSQIAKPISDKRGSAEFRKDIIGVIAQRAARKAYDRALGKY
tara:strand:+ start:82 stop:945 length:864 start_codon:yes stop_codon:yes gene_type:complete